MQLFVLGMHRSGTSMVARALNLMGCYFGAEGTHTAMNPENPKGFWERVDVRRANDALLQGSGFDWDRVSGFSLDRLPERLVSRYRDTCARIFLELDAHRPWLVKEPRLCLLLPLLRDLLERPAAVVVSRDPVEVAMSLEERNGIPRPVGVALWELYTVHALRASSGMPRCFVRHGDLVARPVETIRSLWSDLAALGCDTLREPPAEEISSFVDPDLYRQRRPDESTDDGLLRSVLALDERMREDPEGTADAEDPAVSAGALGLLGLYERQRSLERDLAAGRTAADELGEAADRVGHGLDDLEQAVHRLSGALLAQQRRHDELRDALEAELRQRFDELEAWERGVDEFGRRWQEAAGAATARRAPAEVELGGLAASVVKARKLVDATRTSWRWRAGDFVASTVQRLSGRGRPDKLAVDLALETLEKAEAEIRRLKA